jgi:hypothetical protein
MTIGAQRMGAIMPEGFMHGETRFVLRKGTMLRCAKFSQYKKLFFASRNTRASC